YAGVSICGGIDENEVDVVPACSLNAIDQFTFVITLESGAACAAFCRQLLQALVNIVQRTSSVDLWLACAEQIEVGAVQNKNVLRHRGFFMKTDRLFTLKRRICPLKPSNLSSCLSSCPQ